MLDYLLISSNKRKIYQENVYNGISYPNNYIILYRYDLRYLEKELYDAIFNDGNIYQSTLNTYFRNKNCVLSYMHFDQENSDVYFFRKGIIKHAVFNSNINRLLLFIELKDYILLEDNSLTTKFKNSIVDAFNSAENTCVFDLQSRNYIFGNIKIARFHEIAKIFSSLIHARLFYSITLKEKFVNLATEEYSRIIRPVIDPSTNLSKYHLKDGSNYFLEILTFEVANSYKENNEEKSKYNVEVSTDSIIINEHILDSGSYNLNYIDLMIKPISAETVSTSINLVEPQTKFITNILIDIKKSKLRSILFALSTLLVLMTVPLSNLFKDLAIDGNGDISLSPLLIIVLIIFILTVTVSLRFLYRYFDKK